MADRSGHQRGLALGSWFRFFRVLRVLRVLRVFRVFRIFRVFGVFRVFSVSGRLGFRVKGLGLGSLEIETHVNQGFRVTQDAQ